jgi:hypothetical protein
VCEGAILSLSAFASSMETAEYGLAELMTEQVGLAILSFRIN